MAPYITITLEAIESLQRLAQSGLKGTHLLFSNIMIREAFSREPPPELLSQSEFVERVQNTLMKIIHSQDLDEQRDMIKSLDPELRNTLVHLYFGFLDRFSGDQETSVEVLH
jgi:hypothetical protein